MRNAYARNWVNVNKPVKGDDFLIINNQGQWKRLVLDADFCGWDSTNAGVCAGCHGTYGRGQIYNEDGSKVKCGGQKCWINSCSVCGGCNSRQCDTIGFNADHSDYNYFGGGGNWKSYGSGWQDGDCGGGWERTRRNNVYPLNLLHRTAI